MTSEMERWHAVVKARDAAALDELLADDVVLYSPVLHTPQRGRAITKMYLAAAMVVFANDTFRYVRQVISGRDAVLEFETEVAGTYVNGVDMLRWNDHGKIVDFKVMVRPLKGIQVIQQMMAQQLGAR